MRILEIYYENDSDGRRAWEKLTVVSDDRVFKKWWGCKSVGEIFVF